MTIKNQIYKCETCGNIIEVLHEGGNLVCCGKPMVLLKENTIDASKEKHVPVIEKTKEDYKVKIGSIEHPMVPEHYIEWIELVADNISYKKFLNPRDKPEAEFCLKTKTNGVTTITAREHCNLHGLWSSKL